MNYDPFKHSVREVKFSCFGYYDSKNPLCRRWCALRLSCCRKFENDTEDELLDSLLDSQDLDGPVQ